MKEPFFLPKGTEGRKKDIMILHIQGLVLIVVLLVALMSSLGVLFRTIISEILIRTGLLNTGADIKNLIEYGGMMDTMTYSVTEDPIFKVYNSVMTVWGVIGYVVAFLALGATIAVVIMMRKRITMILEDPFPMDEPVRVKKGAFVWLGFLLGAYGGHLFALKKKKAWIYLALGFVGMWIPIFFLYTSGISFADAFLACFIEKDKDGYIEMEYYPYWL